MQHGSQESRRHYARCQQGSHSESIGKGIDLTTCYHFFLNFFLQVGAAFGAAGQRCMALTTAVVVGEANKWLEEVADKAAKLKLSAGHERKDFSKILSQDKVSNLTFLF